MFYSTVSTGTLGIRGELTMARQTQASLFGLMGACMEVMQRVHVILVI